MQLYSRVTADEEPWKGTGKRKRKNVGGTGYRGKKIYREHGYHLLFPGVELLAG